ncbi:MAG: hypothetical protein ACLQBA_25765 [Candidatus Binataceae bacterium]
MTKSKKNVATKLRRLPVVTEPFPYLREWRLTHLARFVRFAYLPIYELFDEADRMKREVLRSPRINPNYGSAGLEAYYAALQLDLRRGLEQLVDGKAWNLPPVGLLLNCGARQFIGYSEGDFAAVFLRECSVLLNGLERSRLQRCPEADCGSVFVKRKKAKYCAVHSSVQARSRRYRDAIKQRVKPAQLKARRRRYYRNRLAKLRLANWGGSKAHGQ